jgi:murein DD-endopeptidase MepM/ murein hydrolase activator NlpD
MNIILFTNKRGQVWSFELNLVRFGITAVCGLAVAFAAVLYTGIRIGEDELEYLAAWQDVTRQQEEQIATVRNAAQADLDALTLRIGRMQAQMLRLNALGERLVSQGDLDAGEFDFSTLPAVGGPQNPLESESLRYPDFLSMLDDLGTEMEDREQKLSVLETLLMSRSLRERVMPSGRPIEEGWLSSKYGKRNDPFTGKQDFHKGVDFAGKKGAAVLAVGDGVVTWSGERTGYGNLVEISHGNGFVTRYGHNQSHLVELGETVKKGQQIAMMGSSGRSTGPHVHFEVLHDGKTVNPVKYTGE